MAKIGSLLIDLGLQIASFEKNANKATTVLNSNVAQMKRSISSLEKSFQTITAGAGALVGGFLALKAAQGAGALIKMADDASVLQARIQNATKATGDYAAVSAKLTGNARELGSSLEDQVSVFQRIQIGAQELGKSNGEILQLSKTIQQIGTIGGASGEAMKNGMVQFAQSMAGGIVRAEEFNSIIENMPEVAKRMAQGLGLSMGGLRAKMLDGKLTAKEVFDALLKQSDEVQKEFDSMPVTVERAMNGFMISVGNAVGVMNNASGATSILAQDIQQLSEFIDKNQSLWQALGVVIGGFIRIADGTARAVIAIVTVAVMAVPKTVEVALNALNYVFQQATLKYNEFAINMQKGIDKFNKEHALIKLDFKIPLAAGIPSIPTGALERMTMNVANGLQKVMQTPIVNTSKMAGGAIDKILGGGDYTGGKKKKKKKSDAEKEMDRMKADAKSLSESLQTTWEKEAAAIAKAAKYLKLHLIDMKDYNRAVEAAHETAMKAVKINPEIGDIKESTIQKYGIDLSKANYKDTEDAIKKMFTDPFEGRLDGLNDKFSVTFSNINEQWGKTKALLEDIRTPAQQYAFAVEDINKQVTEGYLTQDKANLALQKAKETIFGIQNPLDVYKKKIGELNEALNAGIFTQDEYKKAVKQAGDEYTKSMGESFQQIQGFMTNLGTKFEDTFINIFKDGKIQIKDFFASLFEDLARLVIQLMVVQPLMKKLSDTWAQFKLQQSSGSSSTLSTILGFAGSFLGARGGGSTGGLAPLDNIMRAEGGPVSGMSPYIVGERGPELFTPKNSGNIHPAGSFGGVGGTTIINNITQNIDNSGNRGGEQSQQDQMGNWMKQLRRELKAMVQEQLMYEKLPGGMLNQGIRSY